jgi:site-specific recombinase XerD
MAISSIVFATSSRGLANIQSLVVDSVRSQHSKRAYAGAIADFLDWWRQVSEPALNKAVVQQYRAELENRGLAPASINVRLSAIRRLAAEAADNGLVARELAIGISAVKGARLAGVRTGRWLTREQAHKLLCEPNASTNKGKRDRIVLALLIGCGLRRQELCHLTFGHVQQRDGRWVVADLIGKGGRIRTVPMPSWAKPPVDEWAQVLGCATGCILRRVDKRDIISGRQLSPQAILRIVKEYSYVVGFDIAPHDLRRTFAKLAHGGRSPLEQIQLSLGHSSVATTERYLGVRQDLADAPCDHLGLSLTRDEAW